MRVAITAWEDRISPLFDSAGMFLIADTDKGRILNRQYECFQSGQTDRAFRLFELGTEVLICGAISELSANLIVGYGITLISFIAGNMEKVISAYLNGTLLEDQFQMPGCGCICRGVNKHQYDLSGKGGYHARRRRKRSGK